MAKIKLLFELEKPSDSEYVTQASEIGYGEGSVDDALQELLGGKGSVDNSLQELLGGETTHPISLGDYYDNQYYNDYGRLQSYGTDPKPIAYYPVDVSELLGKELTIKIIWSNYTDSSWCNLICFRVNSDVNTPLSTTNGIIKESTAHASAVNNVATLNVEVTNNYLLIATRDRNATFEISYHEVNQGKIDELQEQIDDAVSKLNSELYPTEHPVNGTFVQNGLIKSNGSFIEYNGYTILSYNVNVGDVLHIKTEIGEASTLTDRAQAAAYNNDTFVEVVAEGSAVVDVRYTVPEGVNKICVYNLNTKSQSVEIIVNNGIKNDVSGLKNEISSINEDIADIGEVLESSLILSKDYVLSDFTTSAYYNLTGSTAPTEVTSSMAIFVCFATPVKAGQTITLKTRGSTNGRAYALTDNQRNILAVAPENADFRNGLELQVAQNGYLYVNDVTSYFTSPSISIRGNNMEILEEEIGSMQNEIDLMHESLEDVGAAKIFNPRIDFQKNGLKILDIGNSYTVDSTHYLPELIQSANIDTQYSLYRLIRSGSSFKNWVDVYNDLDDRTYDSTFIAGSQSQDIPTGTGSAGDGTLMKNVLNVKWDVIIIHQLSTYAPYYKEWEGHTDGGYLKEFIRILKIHCPQAQIGFLLVHSYPSTTSGNVEHDSNLRWAKIAKSAKWIMNNYGMNFVIPYGTGVQNLRQCSEFFDNNELSTDGNHMADGLGDYVAACCYFQQLFGAMRGVSVLGNTYRVTVDETVTGQVSVTDETALLAQKAAILACTDMFTLNNPSEVTL